MNRRVAKLVLSVKFGRAKSTGRAPLPHSHAPLLFHLVLCWRRLWPVLNSRADLDVPVGSLLVELPGAVRALYHIRLFLISWYLACKVPYFVVYRRILICIRILLKLVDLFANPDSLDEFLPLLLPFRYLLIAPMALLPVLILRSRTQRSLGLFLWGSYASSNFPGLSRIDRLLIGNHCFVHLVKVVVRQSLHVVLGIDVSLAA